MNKNNIKKDNERVLDMMRRGENLAMISVENTWYPTRPKIKKFKETLDVVKKSKKLKVVD